MIPEREFLSETPILELDNVGVHYPGSSQPILNNINLKLYEREFVCVLGPSGCGKSTLLKILAGFLKPTEGRTEFDGAPIEGADWHRGVVFQQAPLYPWLTVEENVEFGLRMRGVGQTERRQIAQEYLEKVKLKDYGQHRPYELSGGMKQRVSIARALVNQPRILLMDEPFGALDALTREQMQGLLRNIWEETRHTIFFITHDVDEALLLGTRILVLSPSPGHIVKEFQSTFTYNIIGTEDDSTRYSKDFQSMRAEILGLITGRASSYVI